mmetsp:Transcript_14347/g.25089  ORF Transcript_14347/g.25089 Transcript_14347/m.25089 type:complete len:250 (-) Transcript_14347:415-1164(-)
MGSWRSAVGIRIGVRSRSDGRGRGRDRGRGHDRRMGSRRASAEVRGIRIDDDAVGGGAGGAGGAVRRIAVVILICIVVAVIVIVITLIIIIIVTTMIVRTSVPFRRVAITAMAVPGAVGSRKGGVAVSKSTRLSPSAAWAIGTVVIIRVTGRGGVAVQEMGCRTQVATENGAVRVGGIDEVVIGFQIFHVNRQLGPERVARGRSIRALPFDAVLTIVKTRFGGWSRDIAETLQFANALRNSIMPVFRLL